MKRWLLCLSLLLLLIPSVVFAQDAAESSDESATEAPAVEAQADEVVIHTIIAGQTLYTVAELYDVSLDELLLLNNLTQDDLLSIGQELIVSGVVPLPLGVEKVFDPNILTRPGLPPVPKIHQVQAGDTLTALAERYGIDLEELLTANRFSNETVLQLGMTVYVPNQSGDLFARNYAVQIGDTLDGIAEQFNTDPDLIAAGNRLLHPEHLVAGQVLRLVSRTGTSEPNEIFGRSHIVSPNDTLLSIATQYNQSPREIALANDLPWPTAIYTGQQLRIPSGTPWRTLPTGLTNFAASEQPFRQGETFSLYIELDPSLAATESISPTGRIFFSELGAPIQPWFNTSYQQDFPFMPYGDGYAAIVGIGAFAHPGLYVLEVFTADRAVPVLSQMVRVSDVNFGFQSISVADNIELRSAEDAVLDAFYQSISAEPRWDTSQPVLAPLDNTGYRSAGYGAPRSYAGAPVRIYHSGVDYAAPVNTPIRTVAAGTVVFSDWTDLRGNVVLVDHGWGVISGYFHMEQRTVVPGDVVAAGDLIGALGNTGLSTGAHLHWDMRVHGVPVNGIQWLDRPIPDFDLK